MNASRSALPPRRSFGARSPLVAFACLMTLAPVSGELAGFSSRRVLEISTSSVREDLYARQAALALPHWRGLLERDLDVVTREGADGFKVRLIGKDGGEKLSSTTPVTMPELFAVIDQMPMRQREMERAQPAER